MDAEQNKPEEITWANRVSNLISEKMKDGFYGYLLAAFAIHNWQQIFILFKSKKPIEETLHNLVSQPDFTLNSFWIPLAWGVGASFVIPWIMVGYVYVLANTRSLMASAQYEANENRASKLRIKRDKRSIKELTKSKEKEFLLKTLREIHADIAAANKALADKRETIDNYNNFMKVLNAVYKKNSTINNADDFKRFFDDALHGGIFNLYANLEIGKNSAWISKGANTPANEPPLKP